MKVYFAGIFCRYEGTMYACGIFSTREKAEQAAPWFTENEKYFSKVEHKTFKVFECELDNTKEFRYELGSCISSLEYRATGDAELNIDGDVESATLLEKIKHLHEEDKDAGF